MAKFKPLSVVTIYITWICVACCAENFPVNAEAEEMAVNALFEVSRRMKDDLQLVKVTALQKEVRLELWEKRIRVGRKEQNCKI